MKIFVSIPEELMSENNYNNSWISKVKKEYPNATIWSSYEGDGSIEDADAVLFFYDYKDTRRCKEDIERCRKLNKPYNFIIKLYAPSTSNYLYE